MLRQQAVEGAAGAWASTRYCTVLRISNGSWAHVLGFSMQLTIKTYYCYDLKHCATHDSETTLLPTVLIE